MNKKFQIIFNDIMNDLRDRLKINNAIVRKFKIDKLITMAHFGYGENESNIIIELGRGVTGKCALENKTLIINDLDNYPGEYIKGITGAKSEICFPITTFEKVIGTFNIESIEKNNFDFDKIVTLSKMAKIFSFSISSDFCDMTLNLIKNVASFF